MKVSALGKTCPAGLRPPSLGVVAPVDGLGYNPNEQGLGDNREGPFMRDTRHKIGC
jgi:hypothetical protein